MNSHQVRGHKIDGYSDKDISSVLEQLSSIHKAPKMVQECIQRQTDHSTSRE